MFDRPLFEERLASCVVRCAWGTLLTTVGACSLVVGLVAVLALEASGAVAAAVAALFGSVLVAGIVMLVSARRGWSAARAQLAFGQTTDFACGWTDPLLRFDPKGWADLTAEGGCVYCAEATPGHTRTVNKPIRSARAEQSRSTRHLLFGIIGAATVDGRDLKGRAAAGLSRDAKGIRLTYRECVPCRTARPNMKWMWGALVGALGLGIAGVALGVTHVMGPATGVVGWVYTALIGLPFAAALGFLVAAGVVGGYGNPVQFAKADVNEGVVVKLPRHLTIQAGGAGAQAPR